LCGLGPERLGLLENWVYSPLLIQAEREPVNSETCGVINPNKAKTRRRHFFYYRIVEIRCMMDVYVAAIFLKPRNNYLNGGCDCLRIYR